jgi:hypothetical protein
MALLTRAGSIVGFGLGVVAIGSCAASAPLGHVEAWLRDCDRASGACADDMGGSGFDGEHIEAQAFIDREASRYAPHGLYAYFELTRANGVVGVFELDVPTDAPEDAAAPQFEASYRELNGDRVSFASAAVRGRVAVPESPAARSDADCACDDTGFALTFIDPGADHAIGTGDDAQRRLSLGRMGWSDQFCRSRQVMPIASDLRVTRELCTQPSDPDPDPDSDSEPDPVIAPAPVVCTYGCYAPAPEPEVVTGGGCESQPDDSDVDTETSAGCDSQSDDSSTGCEGDTANDDSSDTGGSCEGDTASDDSSNNGGACDGDTTDDDNASSCAITRAPPNARAHRRGRASPFVGTGLPLLLACLVQVARARRYRLAIALQRSHDVAQHPDAADLDFDRVVGHERPDT